MKIRNSPLCLWAVFCLFSFTNLSAQTPSITTQVGFPVGIKNSVQLAYGNSKYVLLGGYNNTAFLNSLYNSSTATSWNLINPSNLVTTQLNNIAFGAGLFVVVGDGGILQSSPDGVVWTTRTSSTTNNLYRVVFLNSKFFAMGRNRTVLTSADGITWVTMGINTGTATDYFQSLAYGNGVYILSGRNDNTGTVNGAVVYRSTTAANNSWTYSGTAFAPGTTLNRIQFLNNKFFAFNAGNTMYNSTDGTTWTDFTASVVLTNPNSTTTAWNSSHQIFNGVWDGTKYSFYGSSAYYQGYGSTFTSTNGTALTLLTKTAYIVPQESNYINGMYLVCGNEGIVSSSDGLVYKHPGGSYREMVKGTNKYVAVGIMSQDAQIFNSTDFTSWTNRSPAATRELYTIAFDGTNILAGGYQKILRSTNDGDTWTPAYTNGAETFVAMAFGNGRFVAGGYDGSSGFIRYSTDAGQTWTAASSADNYYFKIKYINNRFFAFGYDNSTYTSKIMYSTDGITWTDVTPNLGFEVSYYKDVAFDGTKYHFFGVESVAYTPVQFFSISTATPANPGSYANKAVITNTPAGVTLGGTWDEGTLDYSNGNFTGAVIDAATGQDYIITSANGSSWTAYGQNSYSSITAAYTSGNTVRMIGRGNAFFTVTYNVTLPVSLLSFDGRLMDGKTQLNWVTASEQNAKQFTVEYSTNGARWTSIGTVVAAGIGGQGHQYTFAHATPVKGENFYRLLVEDRDGKSVQSRVIILSANGEKEGIAGYPNPVKNWFVIRTGSNVQGRLTLYNEAGQAVKTATVEGKATVINVSGLPNGIYRIEVVQGQQQQLLTVVKN